MKTASQSFYLFVFALWAPASYADSRSPGECAISPRSIVDDACVSYAALDRLNDYTRPAIEELTHTTDFFSHFRLNLFNKVCPFWDDENSMCGNRACAVDTLENEEDIPLVWRSSELSKLEGPLAKHPGKKAQQQDRPLHGGLGSDVEEGCVVEYDESDERDYCVPEDESSSSKGDYVSLLSNPERFTGYGGEGAKQVWDAIYRENCFQRSSFPHSASLGPNSRTLGAAAQDFKSVLGAAGRSKQLEQQRLSQTNTLFAGNTIFEADDECLEKRVFYRVISGMHASISAHICGDYLNQTTGEWQPNLQCYINRLHDHPERVSNLYFNYALLTRAVAKLGPYLQNSYTFCTGDPSEDAATRAKTLEVTQKAASVPHIFDEGLMFVNGEGPSLKEDFRNRFRNVSRLMDCVGCDKCRLWGKVQTNGYGTALKVLFEFGNKNSGAVPTLKRTEVVALFNTYARLGDSITAIGKFRAMMPDADGEAWTEAIRQAELEALGLDEAEDEELKELQILQRKGPRTDAVGDVFRHQYMMFLMAIRIVVRSWLRVPGRLWYIASTEMVRLFQFWVGLPLNPRLWKIGLPRLDRAEL